MSAATTVAPTATDLTPTRVPWAAVAVYAVLACGLAWLVQLPLWLGGEGLGSPLFLPLTAAMMFTPTIAALVVTLAMVRPASVPRYLGLTPFRPVGRKIALFLLWPVIFLALGFAAFLLAVALGLTEPDWSLQALQAQVDALPPEAASAVTVETLLLLSLLTLPIGVVTSSITAFGEELGWRGFLVTALSPLGFWRSALLSGVLWGVWHAPIILLGYNFGRTDAVGVLLMCVFTLFVGVLLQWSRYWTRNVWPAAVGHGALNATVPLTLLFLSDDADPLTATLLGVPGWIVMAAVIGTLIATGLVGRHLPQPLVPAKAAPADTGIDEPPLPPQPPTPPASTP